MPGQLDAFIGTIKRLRAPDGCPWDREQTHQSLGRYLLEETYEVLEAIHGDDPAKLKEELGDLLLQIVLNAQVAADDGNFDIEDIARAINEKMIKRHPHVFGETSVDGAEQVKVRWEEIKESERKDKEVSPFAGIPKTMPALLQALKISEKAVSLGFEWENDTQVWDKLASELDELKEAIEHRGRPEFAGKHPRNNRASQSDVELEIGDALFCLVNIARWNSVDPEQSLLRAIDKFKKRFEMMESLSEKPLKELSMDEYAELWQESKNKLSSALKEL